MTKWVDKDRYVDFITQKENAVKNEVLLKYLKYQMNEGAMDFVAQIPMMKNLYGIIGMIAKFENTTAPALVRHVLEHYIELTLWDRYEQKLSPKEQLEKMGIEEV
jgi:hypothetical protein